MDRKKMISTICRTAGLATQVAGLIASIRYGKKRMGGALNEAGTFAYFAPAAADKADPTIRHELGLVACTLSAMQLAWYSGLVKESRAAEE